MVVCAFKETTDLKSAAMKVLFRSNPELLLSLTRVIVLLVNAIGTGPSTLAFWQLR